LGRGLSLEQYNRFCAATGLNPLETYATWDGQEFTAGADYVVAVHQKG
jgi:hypothetical protein